MKVNIRSIRWSLGGAAAAAAVILLLGRLQNNPSSVAAAQTAAPTGEKIAVVNLTRVFNGLDEVVHSMHVMSQLQQKYAAKLKAKRAALQKMLEPLNPNSTLALKPGTEEYTDLSRKALRAGAAYQAFKQYAAARVHNANINDLQDQYGEICNAIAVYAKSHGIALVLVKSKRPSDLNSERAIANMIQVRSVLYSARSIDITDKIIMAMNRAWTKAHG